MSHTLDQSDLVVSSTAEQFIAWGLDQRTIVWWNTADIADLTEWFIASYPEGKQELYLSTAVTSCTGHWCEIDNR